MRTPRERKQQKNLSRIYLSNQEVRETGSEDGARLQKVRKGGQESRRGKEKEREREDTIG